MRCSSSIGERLLCRILVLIGLALLAATTAAQVRPTWVEIRADHSNKCLEIWRASYENGAEATQSTCQGYDHQVFNLGSPGEETRIVASHSQKCLTIDPEDGYAYQDDCRALGRFNIFRIDGGRGDDPYWISVLDEYGEAWGCLAVEYGDSSDGAYVRVLPAGNECNQPSARWWIRSVE